MAGKEATVFVLDAGASMGKRKNERTESDLEYGMKFVWDKITGAMASGRKGANMGIIGLRTNETNNPLSADDEAYNNISIWWPLGVITMSDLPAIKQLIQPSSTDDGDAISAIVLAIDRIENFTTLKSGKPGKFDRTIYLITNGEGQIDGEDIELIADRINELDIKLKVM